MERILLSMIIVAAERANRSQRARGGDEVRRLMDRGEYVFTLDIRDCKEYLGLVGPMELVRVPYEPTPLDAFDF